MSLLLTMKSVIRLLEVVPCGVFSFLKWKLCFYGNLLSTLFLRDLYKEGEESAYSDEALQPITISLLSIIISYISYLSYTNHHDLITTWIVVYFCIPLSSKNPQLGFNCLPANISLIFSLSNPFISDIF